MTQQIREVSQELAGLGHLQEVPPIPSYRNSRKENLTHQSPPPPRYNSVFKSAGIKLFVTVPSRSWVGSAQTRI